MALAFTGCRRIYGSFNGRTTSDRLYDRSTSYGIVDAEAPKG